MNVQTALTLSPNIILRTTVIGSIGSPTVLYFAVSAAAAGGLGGVCARVIMSTLDAMSGIFASEGALSREYVMVAI